MLFYLSTLSFSKSVGLYYARYMMLLDLFLCRAVLSRAAAFIAHLPPCIGCRGIHVAGYMMGGGLPLKRRLDSTAPLSLIVVVEFNAPAGTSRMSSYMMGRKVGNPPRYCIHVS